MIHTYIQIKQLNIKISFFFFKYTGYDWRKFCEMICAQRMVLSSYIVNVLKEHEVLISAVTLPQKWDPGLSILLL